MYGYKKEDYLKMEPDAVLVSKGKLHELLNVTMEVYYCPKKDTSHSAFILFLDENMITNTVLFPCDIPENFRPLIAADYMKAYIAKCNFEELDKELNGKCACHPKKDFKSCDQCPELKNGCIGATYFSPGHVNFWEEVEEKWDSLFGDEGSEYKKILIKKAHDDVSLLFFKFGKNKKEKLKLLIEVLKDLM